MTIFSSGGGGFFWFLTVAVVIVFGGSIHQGMANQIKREEAMKKEKIKFLSQHNSTPTNLTQYISNEVLEDFLKKNRVS